MRFLRRRPSPAIVISSVALFMSLGGVGYAATQLPRNSVGSRQLRKEAVTFRKIHPNAVGRVRANTGQLQARVHKTCGPNRAMTAISRGGTPTCGNTLPSVVGTTSNTVKLPTDGASATVASANLAAIDHYLGLANPRITLTPAKGATGRTTTTVTCKLTVGQNTDQDTVRLSTPAGVDNATQSLPLQLTGNGGAATVSCSTPKQSGPTVPGVSVTSAVDAIQIQ